jgi:hypothetical protein
VSPSIVEDSFYLSEDGNIDRLLQMCELSSDEVEEIVGRFRSDHYRFANKLKGEVLIGMDGSLEIRHHFKKNTLWKNND